MKHAPRVPLAFAGLVYALFAAGCFRLAVKKDRGDSEEDGLPPICPACGVTMGIREDRTSTRFVCLECGFSNEAASGS